MIILTKENNLELYSKFKTEIIENLPSRNQLITLSLNGKEIQRRKVFWIYNLLLLTMVSEEDFKTVDERDLLTDVFNTDLFSGFINKFLNDDNKKAVIEILTEFSKLSVIGNNRIDEGLSLHNIIEGYNKYEDFANIIDGLNPDGTPILTGKENIYEVEDKFAAGILNMRKVLENKPDLWFYDFMKNGEGLNFKQLFQTIGFVGSKPVVNYDSRNNGVNTSFIKSNFIKGLSSVEEYFINCTSARKAQVVNRMLIQPSGYFMRRLSLLTIDTLHDNDNLDCGTKVYIKKNIKTSKELDMNIGRHYMDNGVVKTITKDSIELIGQTIDARSPITCKTTHTTGVCKTCFGRELSSKLRYFNSGMLAVLNLTETFTQNMLNAKHFSSTNASRIEFTPEFYNLFEADDINYFSLKDDFKVKSITNYEVDYSSEYENEESEDDIQVTESIRLTGKSSDDSKYSVITYLDSKNKEVDYHLDHDLYLVLDRDLKIDYSNENNQFLDLTDYEVDTAYYIIQNNELATGMNKILAVIDNNDYIKTLNDNITMTDADKAATLLEKFNEALIYYKIDFIKSWNVEMIISNLFFDLNRKYFDFSDPTKVMEIYPVPKALREHNSLSVSLSYERLRDQFSDPHTFNKDRPSKLDSWFR